MKTPNDKRHPTLVLLAVVLAIGAPGASAGDPDPPVAPDPAVLDAAIDRGVDWLLDEQRANGTWGTGRRAVGHTALVVFALLHAGIEEDAADERARRLRTALAWLDRHGPGLTKAKDRAAQVYDMALLVLVERARSRALHERTANLVRLLSRCQARNGQWSYELPRARHHRHDAGDNSNTQFAVLALGAAAGEGVEVSRETLERARAWWLGAAQSDGGFGYASGGSPASASTGSMTAAGIASLAILDAAIADASPSTKTIRGAVARLAEGFEVDRNFGPAQGGAKQRQRNAGRGWVHYFLWSVERAMVLGDLEHLGDRDWFAEGTAHLLATQKKDGSWRGERPLYATCFALLFLTRAADPPRVFTPPDRPRGTITPGGETPEDLPRPALPPGSVRDWLREPLAPDALRAACAASGAGALEALAQALDSADSGARQRPFETLVALLGADRVGRADRHPLARGRLRLWIRQCGRALVARDGRFVLE